MIMKAMIVTLVIILAALVWKLLNRRWSREIYIRRDYEKYQRLDEQVTAGTGESDAFVTGDSEDHSVN